jgi:ABC-type multidrug transport system fused ATPase/permease subunit
MYVCVCACVCVSVCHCMQGGAVLIINTLQQGLLIRASEYTLYRLRIMHFTAYLHLPLSWFDKPERTPAVLVAQLATWADDAGGLAPVRMGVLLQVCASVIASLIIAFLASWRLALVLLGTMPLVRSAAPTTTAVPVADSAMHAGAFFPLVGAARGDAEAGAAAGQGAGGSGI